MINYREYAKALYMLAQENQESEKILNDLLVIKAIFLKYPEYVKLLDIPAVPFSEKTHLIDEAFSECEENIRNFIKMLCERHAGCQMVSCIAEYQKLYNAANGIEEALCITARPLQEAQITALKAKLETVTGMKIILKWKQDPEAIGGIILRIGGKQLDGSLRSQLDEFRKNLECVRI